MNDSNLPARVVGICLLMVLIIAPLPLTVGCSDDAELVREIQNRQQLQTRSKTQQDHLGEMFQLLSDFVDLNREKAGKQITYHLNQWRQRRSDDAAAREAADDDTLPELLETVSEVLPTETAARFVLQKRYSMSDVHHLRDSYLFRQVIHWVDQPNHDDPLLSAWFESVESELGEDDAGKLRTASRLFDWTVRNISLERREQAGEFTSPPRFSFGMTFQGVGYRQTDYETLWRGIGDALQRAGVFTQLCRQADLPAAVLAIAAADSGELIPWCVGVRIGDEVYLFETELGVPIAGPGQTGIATLQQARKDATVMRRLNVPGFFDYPWDKDDIQQNTALLNVLPVTLSPRMRQLQSGLTGNRRMRLYVDAAEQSEQWDAVPGIAGVRLWNVPLLAEVYRAELQSAAERDPRIAFWYRSRWAMLEADFPSARQLARGRWEHLHGRFADDEIESEKGARTYYLTQRAPEFEIDDLRIDVELQKSYGIRRELRSEPEVYDRQVRQVQELMRLGKRTATYWLSLVQYDDERYDTSMSWLKDRVMTPSQRSFWETAARYNRARTAERLGDIDDAITQYKTEGVPQEHGNRIRARHLAKSRPQ